MVLGGGGVFACLFFLFVFSVEKILAEGHEAFTKLPVQFEAPRKRPDMMVLNIPNMQNYQRKMEAKAMMSGTVALYPGQI